MARMEWLHRKYVLHPVIALVYTSLKPWWLRSEEAAIESRFISKGGSRHDDDHGAKRWYSGLEVSAIAAAGFHKENYPEDTVQIRTRADGTLRSVLGYARLEWGLPAARKDSFFVDASP